jgi:cytochrome c biogenesis protein CcmG/thiol:disulfide interchange protein DsbE
VRTLSFTLLAVICLLSSSCNSGSRPPHIGDFATDFTLQDSDRNVALAQFRGQVVLLNFWATWCPPCVEEMPSLIKLQRSAKEKGFVILGISIDVDADAYHRFLKQHEVNFLTVRDPEQRVAHAYGTLGWPETYIIDRSGVIRRKVVGPIDWTAPEMMQYLSKM